MAIAALIVAIGTLLLSLAWAMGNQSWFIVVVGVLSAITQSGRLKFRSMEWRRITLGMIGEKA